MAKRAVPILVVSALVLLALLAGWLRPLDNWLMARRMEAVSRAPTGTFVLVDIDPRSITAIGRWPWPRQVHANVIDALLGLDARGIAFDVDFSSASTPEGDAALEAALKRAGGSVILAALDQTSTANGEEIHHNRPIPAFAANAWLADVRLRIERDGKVRRLYYARAEEDGVPLPSMPAMLAGGSGAAGESFDIDYGIRADLIERFSVIDLLDGKVARDRIAGKTAIIGASALELRDIFAVPIYGTISGNLLQAMGAESIIQGRALKRTSLAVSLAGLVVILGLGLCLVGRGWRQQLALLAIAAVLIEAGALAVFAFSGIEVRSASWLAFMAALMITTLIGEIDFRRILLAISGTRVANTQAILDSVIADSFAGVLVIAEDGTVIAGSRSAARTLGIDRAIKGENIDRILPAGLREAVRGAVAQAAGAGPREITVEVGATRRVLEFIITLSRLSGGIDERGRKRGDYLVTCLAFIDVTDRKEALDRTAFLARFDPLTGLPNRNQFIEQASALLAGPQEGGACAVLCIDLDRFKTVNDTLGHGFGDLLLMAVAERMNTMAPPGLSFARLGGDDFSIILPGPGAEKAATALARRLIASANRKAYTVEGHRLVVAMSVGIAFAEPGTGGDPLAALKRADMALYAAKAKGGNCFSLFEDAMIAGLEARQRIELEVWEAFQDGQFELAYQPQFDLADGRVIGVEALLRWHHPQRGFIPPSEFIPVIETIGLMEAAGRFVLEEACTAAVQWPEDVRVAVNVSTVQFTRDDLVALVSETLASTGLKASRLELEITESWFMNETQALADTLNRIRATGVTFALDDFGTGYSSLSYIRKFPIDKIKIDRSFVSGLPYDHGSIAIVRAVAAMAESLSLGLIAEGIEIEEQARFLRLLGVHEAQGFYFARPMTAHALTEFLGRQRTREPVRLIG